MPLKVTDAGVTAALETLSNDVFKQAIYDGLLLIGTATKLINEGVAVRPCCRSNG